MALICVDGVVGVGKTSLVKLLSKRYNIVFYEEPMENNKIIEKFYYDKERWSFSSQVYFLNKRYKMLKDSKKFKNCLMDRSIYGDAIFSKMLVDDGHMSIEEYDLYKELLETFLENIEKPKLMIYLEISPENAIKRINKRGREYEQQVSHDYWIHLDKNYREFFKDYKLSDFIKINVDNFDFVENEKDREYIFKLIDEKLGL